MNPSPPTEILPVKRSLRQTQQYYNRLSRWYDLLSGSTERRYTIKALELVGLKPGETILEIGFGTGHALEEMIPKVKPNGMVVGIDLSPGMARLTQKRLAKQSAAREVHLTCGDAADLPYPDASFEAAFLSFTLELFDTPIIFEVLAECKRILKQSGRLAVVVLSKPNQAHFGVAVYEWFHRTFPGAVDCRPIPARIFIEEASFKILQVHKPHLLGILPLEIILAAKDESS